MPEVNPAFWKKYAQAYDAILGNFSGHKALVEATADELTGCKRILESGCGPGHLTDALLKRRHVVYALDINPEAVNLLHNRCGQSENLVTKVADANSLPFENDFFDGISSLLVLWAMPDPKKYLIEHQRVLKPSGKIVIAGPGPETKASVNWILEQLKADLERQGLTEVLKTHWQPFLDYTSTNINHTGENWYTREEISNLLKETGFDVQSMKPNPIYFDQGHLVTATPNIEIWANKSYSKILNDVEALEKTFPADLKDEEKVTVYKDKLHRAHTVAIHFNQMAFLGDFGPASERYYEQSNNLYLKLEELIKKIYR